MLKKIESTQEFESVINTGLVLVDFFADWCGPCKIMGPILDKVSDKYEGKIGFYKVNVDQYQELASQFEVMSIPTVVILKDGNVVDNFIGVKSDALISKMLDGIIESTQN
jgi:thioredoxin 1